MQGFWIRIVRMEKIKEFDEKAFENWLRVTTSKLNVSEYDLKIGQRYIGVKSLLKFDIFPNFFQLRYN